MGRLRRQPAHACHRLLGRRADGVSETVPAFRGPKTFIVKFEQPPHPSLRLVGLIVGKQRDQLSDTTWAPLSRGELAMGLIDDRRVALAQALRFEGEDMSNLASIVETERQSVIAGSARSPFRHGIGVVLLAQQEALVY